MEAENNSRFSEAICGDTGFRRHLYEEWFYINGLA